MERDRAEKEISLCFRKTGHPRSANEAQGYERTDVSYTLNIFDVSETRTPTLVIERYCKVYDARGNGGGEISPTITGDHQNRITDYTAIVLDMARGAEDECI